MRVSCALYRRYVSMIYVPVQRSSPGSGMKTGIRFSPEETRTVVFRAISSFVSSAKRRRCMNHSGMLCSALYNSKKKPASFGSRAEASEPICGTMREPNFDRYKSGVLIDGFAGANVGVVNSPDTVYCRFVVRSIAMIRMPKVIPCFRTKEYCDASALVRSSSCNLSHSPEGSKTESGCTLE